MTQLMPETQIDVSTIADRTQSAAVLNNDTYKSPLIAQVLNAFEHLRPYLIAGDDYDTDPCKTALLGFDLRDSSTPNGKKLFENATDLRFATAQAAYLTRLVNTLETLESVMRSGNARVPALGGVHIGIVCNYTAEQLHGFTEKPVRERSENLSMLIDAPAFDVVPRSEFNYHGKRKNPY